MNFIIYHLKRLIMLPVLLVTSPAEVFGDAWKSARNRSLILGLPALIIAFLAVTAIGGVQLLNRSSLETKYDFLFQKTTADLNQLSKEISRDQKLQSLDGSAGNAGGITKEQAQNLDELRKSQKIFLDKLISLDPTNKSYRFELAKMVFSQGKANHGRSILKELAPEDVPGHPEAHFVLARMYSEEKAPTAMARAGNLSIALKHVDHVLTRDEKNDKAKLLKARILSQTRNYDDAYRLFSDLFEENPNFFRELEALNEKMKRTERNQQLYGKAYDQFKQLSGQKETQENDRAWITNETGLAMTLQKMERFKESEDRLESLIQKYAADRKGGPRRVFLQRLITETYLRWANSIADATVSYQSLPANQLETLLELYTKAYRNQPANPQVLQSLARLSLSGNTEIAQRARVVYDPIADRNAPSSVLNQLGNDALINKRFTEAIRYYERAREKSPRDSAVLNNLSFSYLVAEGDDQNAERALQLIDEALRNLPQGISPLEASKFLHTKATALKQQDRLQEALAVYERALKARPQHADTLRSLIECYRGLSKIPPERYGESLKKIETQMRQNQGISQ